MSKPSPDNQLLPLHRLAILYLLLPVAVFLLGWFHWWLSLPLLTAMVVSLWPLLAGSCKLQFSLPTLGLLLLALAWVMLTGAGGFFDTNTNADWIKNDAILLDMSRSSWPTLLPTEGNRPEPMLRYYLGYYMVPGLAGRLLGAQALNWAVPLWTFTGVALLMLLFTRKLNGWALWLGAAILILFSGMDIVRVALLENWSSLSLGASHIEWDYNNGVRVQYSANMVGLMYVPQHFIAAGLFSLLLLDLRRNQRFIPASGVVIAASLFWSPFVALGLLPLVGVMLWENRLRGFISWQNVLIALPLAGLLLTYLLSGSANFPQGWLWDKYSGTELLGWLPIFLLNQFGLLAALLWWLQPGLRRDGFFLAALATLVLLPWYHYGYFNDLPMRASLPALFLLCYYASQALAKSWPLQRSASPARLPAALFIVLCVGAATPVFEIARVLNFDDGQRRRYETLEYTTLSTVHRFFRGQYMARDIPPWYQRLLRNSQQPADDNKDNNGRE